nr:MAG TPA: hypothetical protein [Caudoviricetes sp.]
MKNERMKIDYNNFTQLIMETVQETEGAEYIKIGLGILTAYIQDIAALAVKRDDAELLELCKGLLIVKEKDDE